MNQPKKLVGKDFYLEFATVKKLMQAGQADLRRLTTFIHESFGLGATPFLANGGGSGAGSRHILRLQTGIADNPNVSRNRLQRLARRFDDGTGKISGDAVIRFGSMQTFHQERLNQFLAAGGKAVHL